MSEFILHKNGSPKIDDEWVPDDKLYLKIENKDHKRYAIELRDYNNNCRFCSYKGSEVIEFTVVIPYSEETGKWTLSIVSSNFSKEISINVLGKKDYLANKKKKGKKDTKEMKQTKGSEVNTEVEEKANVEDLTDTEEQEAEEKEKTKLEVKTKEFEESEEIEDKSEPKDLSIDEIVEPESESKEKPKEEEREETEELQDIFISERSIDEISSIITNLETEEQLEKIQEIQLAEEEKEDLNIPIAEIESMDSKYYRNLRDANINTIAILLENKPLTIKTIAEAPISEIQEWYHDVYKIYKKPNHSLRKEYRKIRAFSEGKEDELKRVRNSPKADDTLEVLSGVSIQAREKLEEVGIVKVIDILEYPLEKLMVVEVDPKKPLLWKVWVANAKSHFGIH